MRSSMRLASYVAAVTVWSTSGGAKATTLDPAFTEALVTTVPSGVTSMAWAPDDSGRLFLTLRTGEIRVVQDGVLAATPFATVSPVYPNVTETGLLGLDFDRDFANNGYLYVFVTVSATEQQVVRYTSDGEVGVDPTVIVPGLPTRGRNHNGGGLGVGPDGKLYFAVGDNGNGTGVNDDLSSLASKVGRAELDGSVPSDNPFADGDGPNQDLIWARGLRNPFTLTWQPETEKLWVNVVGTRYEQVFVLEAGDHGGWNKYDSTQPAGFVVPAISYPTGGPLPFTILADGAARSGGVATFKTQVAHRMHPGVRATVTGVADSSFNTTAVITETPDATTLAFAQAGPDAVSGGGAVAGPEIGGCITGGTFWDSTSVPESYRGNFFFGDYNSGRLERAQLSPNGNQVVSVDHWAEDLVRPIDMAVGPDGDLYYVVFGGGLFRARYQATEQGIVISKRYVRLGEGGRTALGVRLSALPSDDVMVAVERTSGDVDVTTDRELLLFDADTWDVPQFVFIEAAEDLDTVEDVATLVFSAEGLSATATARVNDNDLVDQGGGEAGAASGGAGGVSQGQTDYGGAPEMGGEPAASGGLPASAEGGGPAAREPELAAGDSSGGCSCRAGGVAVQGHQLWFVALLASFALRRRRLTVRVDFERSRC